MNSQLYEQLLKQNEGIKNSLQELQKYVDEGTLTKEEAVRKATEDVLRAKLDAERDMEREGYCTKCGDIILGDEPSLCGRCV